MAAGHRNRPARWLFGAIAGLALLLGPAAAGAAIGQIRSAVGHASVQRAKAVLAVAPGLALEEGDVIVTGADGHVAVAFTDQTRMAVGPNAHLMLERYKFDPVRGAGAFITKVDRGSIQLVSGRIARSGKDRMQVRSPTALLGVRGTRFVVEVK